MKKQKENFYNLLAFIGSKRPDYSVKNYIDWNLKGNAYGIHNIVFRALPDDLRQYYLDKAADSDDLAYGELEPNQWDAMSQEQKNRFLQKRFDCNVKIIDQDFNSMPDELKKLFLNTRAAKGWDLTESQFELLPDSMKRQYVSAKSKFFGKLTEKEMGFLPEDDKTRYFAVRKALSSKVLTDQEYEILPEDMKERYLSDILMIGAELPAFQYGQLTDKQKLQYLKMRIFFGTEIDDDTYDSLTDHMKFEYIKGRIENKGRKVVPKHQMDFYRNYIETSRQKKK